MIMDVHGDDLSLSDPDSDLIDAMTNFRNAASAQHLKYGAAYAPNLETDPRLRVRRGADRVSTTIDGAAGPTATRRSRSRVANNELYERAKAAIRDLPLMLPPSPAMAGVYAQVDADRGVWKAPANVPLNAVIKPTIEFSNVQNDDMNVDPTAGKSVNAHPPVHRQGHARLGARTLAGNDNEWRYVNVRRFFNFVEESIKKATEQFVFEPNDANTWVKVQAMIENFLTVQWRDGALAGHQARARLLRRRRPRQDDDRRRTSSKAG